MILHTEARDNLMHQLIYSMLKVSNHLITTSSHLLISKSRSMERRTISPSRGGGPIFSTSDLSTGKVHQD